MFAKRMKYIRASGIRKVFDLAATMKDPINLSIGQPDFTAPGPVKESMIKAIKEDKMGYTQSQGLSELRNEVLAKLKRRGVNAESVLMTSGASGGLLLAYSVLLDEGDEMIVFDPYFVMYPDLCEFLGAKAVIVQTNKDFSINIDALKKAITPRTKAIMFNSPNNPSGHVASREEVQQLVEVAEANDLWVFSDEIYEDLIYEGEHVSPAEYYDKTLVLSGFSKSLAIPSMRLGYAAGPKELIDQMITLQQYTFVCPPSIAQYAVLGNTEVMIDEHVKEYAERAELVYKTLSSHFELERPQGAFYAFVKAPINGTEFVTKCIKEKDVLIIPGLVFSKNDTHFRISFATIKKNLEQGLKRIVEVKEKLINSSIHSFLHDYRVEYWVEDCQPTSESIKF